jgi:hypothetical protein
MSADFDSGVRAVFKVIKKMTGAGFSGNLPHNVLDEMADKTVANLNGSDDDTTITQTANKLLEDNSTTVVS